MLCISQDPKIVQGQEGGMKFKLLEIDDFSMYWDTDTAPYGDLDMKQLRVRSNLLPFLISL